MTGIALAGWDRTGWGRPQALADHWMRFRDRRAPVSVLVLAIAYAAILLWPLSVGLHWLTGTAVADDRLADWLLTATTLLLVWRLGMRVGCTAHDHGWRQAGWSLPRFFVGNIIALIAAPRAIRRYLTLLRGGPLIWGQDRTRLSGARHAAGMTGGRPLRFPRDRARRLDRHANPGPVADRRPAAGGRSPARSSISSPHSGSDRRRRPRAGRFRRARHTRSHGRTARRSRRRQPRSRIPTAAARTDGDRPAPAMTTTPTPRPTPPPPLLPLATPAAITPRGPSRLAGSVWGITRDGGIGQASGGQLGGSQAGSASPMRWAHRAASRSRRGFSTPARRPWCGSGAGPRLAADPVADPPARRTPHRDRRWPRGYDARSRRWLWAPRRRRAVTVEGYGQAGLIARDGTEAFVDGALRLAHPIARRGKARLDVGIVRGAGAARRRATRRRPVARPRRAGRQPQPPPPDRRLAPAHRGRCPPRFGSRSLDRHQLLTRAPNAPLPSPRPRAGSPLLQRPIRSGTPDQSG